MDEQRPNPDIILEKLQRSEEKRRRGRLKIFFGACAGVGKTYAMLQAAQTLYAQKINLVVGLVETHGRPETMALLKDLVIIPPKNIEYHSKVLHEFDLDAVLNLKPSIVLLDELAHSNVKGSRHEKRWQDVEELLNAGIDVFSTLNVQHLESLNDVVGHITSVRVYETIPDYIFDNADEVILVDLPPDELLQRLHEGKVYLVSQIRHAVKNFFRKGNLIALRELALRRMADRVDKQMSEYRTELAIQRVWQAKEKLLVCVSPGASGEQFIRKAYRLANSLHADWQAVYVETPRLQKLSKNQRKHILKNQKLARELGSDMKTLFGVNIAETIIKYARTNNVTKIIVGKSQRSRVMRLFKPALADQFAELIADIDIYIVSHEVTTTPKTSVNDIGAKTVDENRRLGYLWATIICGLITIISAFLVHYVSLVNVVMLYLLGVLVTAVRFDRGPSIFASFISVAAFNYFFVFPNFSFTAYDLQYIITFIIMLATALIITNLTANLRYQARIAIYRERRANALSELSKELSTALSIQQIIEISSRHLHRVFQIKISFLLPDLQNKIHPRTGHIPTNIVISDCDPAIAQWVFDHQQVAGFGTQTLAGSPILYLPLCAPISIRGVLAILQQNSSNLLLPEQQNLLDSFVAQIALSLEHIHYVEVARDALLTMEIERLRNAILDIISRELDKPLQEIANLSTKLMTDKDKFEQNEPNLLLNLHNKIQRLHKLVSNLLDMARLQVGKIEINKRKVHLNRIIQSAIKECEHFIKQHQVIVHVPSDFPAVVVDPILLERVFYLLLENAGKFTPIDSQIIISAEIRDQKIWITVEDNGPGLPKGMEKEIFEKFTKGQRTSDAQGFGLGLAICRAIIETHEGQIFAENIVPTGSRFSFWIPALS